MSQMATLNTKGGLTLRVREATSGDRSLLIDSFASLSPESRYARFFTAMPYLCQSLLDKLLDLGNRDHLAIIAFGPAVQGETAPAVGAIQLVKSTYTNSGFEFALTVLDAYHKQGIGSGLVAAIGAVAHHLGILSISAEVLAKNTGMRHLLASFGADIRRDPEDARVLLVELSTAAAASRLQPTERQEITALFDHLAEVNTDQ